MCVQCCRGTEMCLPAAMALYLLAIFPFQVEVVGGVHAPVHALLVAGDPTLDRDALWCGTQSELLQVIHVNGWLTRNRSGRGGCLLSKENPHREHIHTHRGMSLGMGSS